MEAVINTIRLFWVDLQHGQLPELGPWNYLLLAVLIVMQGPIATLLGGAAASAGLLRPSLVFVVSVVASLTADLFWYSVGYLGKIEWVWRYGHWLGLRREHVEKFQERLHQHASKFLLMAKLSAGLALPALIAAGLAKIRWRRWFPVVFLGETLWTGTILLVGYSFTEAIKRVEQSIHIFAFAVSVVFLLALLWFLPRAFRQLRANATLTEADPMPTTAKETAGRQSIGTR